MNIAVTIQYLINYHSISPFIKAFLVTMVSHVICLAVDWILVCIAISLL